MRKKWRIYPRGAAFWVSFGILMLIACLCMTAFSMIGFSEEKFIWDILSTVVLFLLIIGIILWFLLANISIDENDCLNMPFFCRHLMPLCSEKKRKIILKKNLVDVHLLLTYVYTYLGFEDENGDVTMINVTLFSKKQQEILQHKLEEYKKEEV